MGLKKKTKKGNAKNGIQKKKRKLERGSNPMNLGPRREAVGLVSPTLNKIL